MAIAVDKAFEYILCMDVQPHGLKYALVKESSKKIEDTGEFSFQDFSRETLDSILTQDFFKQDFGAYVLSTGNNRNTLIPVEIFNHSGAQEIFKLNYSEPLEDLDYNRIPELSIVNIYELPLWLKKAFIVRFPRIKFVHQSTALLKGVFNRPTFSPKVHLHIDKEYFVLMCTGKQKLQFYNLFQYKSIADISYHTLFVLEQKEISPAEIEVNVYGVDRQWEGMAELQKFFKNPLRVESKENGEHFALANQVLCV